jgi:uncharacterized protein YgiM (DUF1202 family)
MNTNVISRFLTVTFLFFAFSTFTAAQTDWSFVAIDTDYDVWFVDKAVIKKKSGIIAAWMKTVHRDKSYNIALNEWNCAEKMKRLLQVQTYDSNTVLTSMTVKTLPWRYVVPDSVEAKAYNIICGDLNKRTGTARNDETDRASSFAQITVRNANLMSEADSKSEVIRKVNLGEKLTLVSEKPVGVWYRVLDPKTNSEGWLNGYHFKIVNARQSSQKAKSGRRKRRN